MPATLRSLRIFLLLSAPLLFVFFALAMGKKTGWDLYNYHWYNPYALLNHRFGVDVAVSHHATYYNPLSDVPLYVLTRFGPSWLGGIFLGLMAGITVALVGLLGNEVLPYKSLRNRAWIAAALALIGALGAGAFQEIGDPANDVPAAIGIFVALILIVRQINRTSADRLGRVAFVFALAGFSVGAAVALKLTIAVYAIGVAGALAIAGTGLKQRLVRLCSFGVGGALGLALVGGFWMYRLWQYSGNPFFPYFNDVFHSDLLSAANYRDLNFRPHGLLQTLFFPLYFTLDSHKVSESTFRDAHILFLYVLLPLALVLRFALRRQRLEPIPESTKFLFAFAICAYLAWLAMFDIYRYLVPLEMLSPLLIALAISTWPVQKSAQLAATIALLITAQLLVRIDISDRQSWQGDYVRVDVPKLNQPENTMVVMTGHAPMAYVIPYFPSSVPFVRIDSWLISGDDRETGLAREMRRRVAQHDGPIFALFERGELEMAARATQSYGLELTPDVESQCGKVESNINRPLMFCPVTRQESVQLE